MSNHHPSDPSGSNPASDHIAEEAAAGIAALETWLTAPGELPISDGPRAAWQRASGLIVDSMEVALSTIGVSEHAVHHLVIEYEMYCRRAGREPRAHLSELRWSPEKRALKAWSEEHVDEARADGGVLAWDELDHNACLALFRGQVLTVDEVRELARDGELQAINGIGPARELAILEALAATDCDGDWLR